ncbi:hypothetical protein F917_02529 [Acinetobacter baumannii NIPH 67]|nr:hypothetical protein F917_02529 [Acinetobacter baumannii NIPH 67]
MKVEMEHKKTIFSLNGKSLSNLQQSESTHLMRAIEALKSIDENMGKLELERIAKKSI